MRLVCLTAVLAMLGLALTGCSNKPPFKGPTVDAFKGRITHNGNPVSIDPEAVEMKVAFETGRQFGIPLKPDGAFDIGWMPIGKYSVTMIRKPKTEKAGPQYYNVPGGLTIEDGKTEYTIELGPGWKP
jgi:hypothetical protein